VLASVVIPAYNEAVVIDRCLAALSGVTDVRVVVVANGCTDDTAQRARKHGADVVEVQRASKAAALNAGDAATGQIFPRVYLDADVDLELGALKALIDDLSGTDVPAVGMPRLRIDLAGSSWVVRSFYRVYSRLPYLSEGLVGAGCYAVNRAGRERWGQFPDIVADDLFVQGLFLPQERHTVDAACTTHAPRRLGGLLKVRTRTYHGNRQAARVGLAGHMQGSRHRSVNALLDLVLRHPALVPDALVYLVVNVLAQRRAARMGDDSLWLTDESSRGWPQ
jgi:glycosyltransferase involved in cell wall biosynthesis